MFSATSCSGAVIIVVTTGVSCLLPTRPGGRIIVAAGQISEYLGAGQFLDFFFGSGAGIGGDREEFGHVLRPVSDVLS